MFLTDTKYRLEMPAENVEKNQQHRDRKTVRGERVGMLSWDSAVLAVGM